MNILKNKFFINALFLILIFAGLFISLLIYRQNIKNIDIPILGHAYADVFVNVEAKNLSGISVYADDEEMKFFYSYKFFLPSNKNNFIFNIDNRKIRNLKLKVKNDEELNKIDNIIVFVSDKMTYFTREDILKFKKEKGDYIIDGKINFMDNSKYVTDKGFLKHFSIFILSFFYKFYLYLIPLIFFMIAFYLYIKNKEKILLNFSFIKENAIWIIVITCFLIRIADTKFSFWDDELYSAVVAGNPNSPFIATFQDPGNPPLFFILTRFFVTFTGYNEVLLRLLPCLFSVLTIYVIYLFVKKYLNENIALICSFLFSINVYSIYSAMELRCYSLCMLFAVLSGFLLFKIQEEKSNKYITCYGILACLMANTYYYQIIILILNFIWGMFNFDNNKLRLKFLIANFVAGISFIPYFYITCFQKTFLDSSFNEAPAITIDLILEFFTEMFFGYYVALCSLIILLLYIISITNKFLFKEDKNFYKVYLYSGYMVLGLFYLVYIISLFRNIGYHAWYYTNCLPFIVIMIVLSAFSPLKFRNIKILTSVFILGFYLLCINYFHKELTILYSFENLFKYAYIDSFRYPDKKHCVVLHDYLEYIDFYNDYKKGDTEYIIYKWDKGILSTIPLIKKSKSDIIYLRVLYSENYIKIKEMLDKIGDVTYIVPNKYTLYYKVKKFNKQ